MAAKTWTIRTFGLGRLFPWIKAGLRCVGACVAMISGKGGPGYLKAAAPAGRALNIARRATKQASPGSG
jgi:hypothetical protein